MWGSAVLEVVIGIAFVYALVSTLCTAVREGIDAWLKTRAAYLEHGIRQLLDDAQGKGLAAALYAHPLIASLYQGQYEAGQKSSASTFARGRGKPSYIPARNFAAALLDIAARGPIGASQEPSVGPPSVDSIRASLAKLQNPAVERVLSMALDAANGDLQAARTHVEAWFDSAMDRVSGWYRRSTQWINLCTALFVVVTLNVDTFTLTEFLYRNATVRSAVVTRAERMVDAGDAAEGDAQLALALQELQLPIGWDVRPAHLEGSELPSDSERVAQVLKHALGLLLTTLAATLGAPFWFDVLNKFMVIRSTVKPHEKSPEEGSEDRRTRARAAPAQVVYVPYPPAHEHSAPREQREDQDDADGCGTANDVDATTDEELPAATGGVVST